MTATEAEWVRATVWTTQMRVTFDSTPGFYTACACQWGATGYCQQGNHEKCRHCEMAPYAQAETHILDRKGQVARFLEDFAHPTTHAVGPRRERNAMVWLADRACRWRCQCDCGHDREALKAKKQEAKKAKRAQAKPAQAKPAPTFVPKAKPMQLSMFDHL
jgi:hypothetical protein